VALFQRSAAPDRSLGAYAPQRNPLGLGAAQPPPEACAPAPPLSPEMNCRVGAQAERQRLGSPAPQAGQTTTASSAAENTSSSNTFPHLAQAYS